jgi:hypothetical protein
VHALLSVHKAALATNAQPLAGLQLSSVQGLPSLQVAVAPGLQAPVLQVSPKVHKLPSLHGAVLAADLQPPEESHVSVVQGS